MNEAKAEVKAKEEMKVKILVMAELQIQQFLRMMVSNKAFCTELFGGLKFIMIRLI